MQFKEFDTSRIDEYTRRAKESWGDTPAYREFEQNAAERTVQESSDINNQLMALTAGFGALQNLPIDNPAVQAQAAAFFDGAVGIRVNGAVVDLHPAPVVLDAADPHRLKNAVCCGAIIDC